MQVLIFITEVIAEPAIIIGLFTMIGLILSKKHFTKIIDGTIKSALGFVLLAAGAGILEQTLLDVNEMFVAAFNVEGVIPLNEAVISLTLAKFGAMVSLVMIFSMFVNMLWAKFTRFKYIFLTGHHILFMSALVVAVLTAFNFNNVVIVVSASIITGTVMTLSPAILQPYTRKITGSDDIALGHFGSFGYFVAAQIGRLFKNKSKSVEDINVPKSLNFLRDSTIQIALSMLIMVSILVIFVPSEELVKITDGENILVYVLNISFKFTAGVWVVLQGVKMTISEIVPAFKGISSKFIKGATPALDCPVVFPYSTNAVLVGFISSFVGGIVMLFILPLFGLVVIIPIVMTHFFTGATAGIYGNAVGGYKGAIVGAFVNGILVSLLPAIFYPIMAQLGFVGTTFADTDMALVGIIVFLIGGLFSS